MTTEALVTIEATKREKTGTGYCTKLRKSGKIPAILNNKGTTVQLSLDPKFLSKAWKSGKTFNLSLDGKMTAVLITDLQIDNVKRIPLHVDLTYAK